MVYAAIHPFVAIYAAWFGTALSASIDETKLIYPPLFGIIALATSWAKMNAPLRLI